MTAVVFDPSTAAVNWTYAVKKSFKNVYFFVGLFCSCQYIQELGVDEWSGQSQTGSAAYAFKTRICLTHYWILFLKECV